MVFGVLFSLVLCARIDLRSRNWQGRIYGFFVCTVWGLVRFTYIVLMLLSFGY